MNVLITGANGFLGKNLVENLKNVRDGKSRVYPQTDLNLFCYDLNNSLNELESRCACADYIFHLAGVNRPKDKSEFYTGNVDFTKKILEFAKKGKKPTVVLSSSVWAEFDNDYGKSKKMAEDEVFGYAKETDAKCNVYRFTNLFGKWSRPSYNSVVATFCYNVANSLPLRVDDENALIKLNYVDDVVYELINGLFGKENRQANGYCKVEKEYAVTVGELAKIITSFKSERLPDLSDEFTKKLYSVYTSFLPYDKVSRQEKTSLDERGSFSEIFKLSSGEQVSLNIVKSGKVKGNHWHNTKVERFTVIKGEGVIRLRKIGEQKVYEYKNEGKILSVDIPAGVTHNVENLGEEDLYVLIWCNEPFDEKNPDTFFEEV